MSDDTTIRDDVIEALRAAGFEVRDNDGIFAVSGTIDSGAVLIEALMEREKKFEKRGYANGYVAGRNRVQRDVTDQQRYNQDAAFLDRAYLALLPVAMTVQGWKIGEKQITTSQDRVDMAVRWARKALQQRPTP